MMIKSLTRDLPHPGLGDLSIAIMEGQRQIETVRAVDLTIATGVYPDITEHGWERADRPTTQLHPAVAGLSRWPPAV
jgi:hypothetical protein